MILSGYQVMVKTFAARRPSLNNVWKEVFSSNGPTPKSLIEISGETGIGKSIVLYELMARSLLTDFFGGKHCQVILLDFSHKFDLNNFAQLVQNVMMKNVTVNSRVLLEDPLSRHCETLICLPCYSADQLEFAFEEIEDLLWDYRKISLIAIDGLENFYWEDCNKQLQRMATHYRKLLQRLKSICKEHNICCAFTVDADYLAPKSKHSGYFFNSLIDHKMELKMKGGNLYLNNSHITLNHCGVDFL